MVEPPGPTRMAEPTWLEPYPDALLEGLADTAPGPRRGTRSGSPSGWRSSAALQHLPPRQRAALVLRDVLGFRAAEAAGMLDTARLGQRRAAARPRDARRNAFPPAVSSEHRCRRPRASKSSSAVSPRPSSAATRRRDRRLLTDDAWLTMPPEPYEYQGARGDRQVPRRPRRAAGRPLPAGPTRANGQPAFGCYLPDPHAPIARAYGLMVLTLTGDRVSAITWFGDSGLLAHFGLPRTVAR